MTDFMLMFPTQVIVVLRGTFVILMLVCNGLMWTIFANALQKCNSTVEATVTNTAGNFFFTVSTAHVY